jgi:DNA-binding LacI/PurR family transcriptional regulator
VIGIRELARHLDISIGTVSRALNGKADVNSVTRQRVLEAAAKLGYAPNQSGRSLRRGQTDLVGVIVPTGSQGALINSVFLSVLDGLRRKLLERRLDLAIFLHGEDEEIFGTLRGVTERGLVDGLIISNTLRVDPRIDYLLEKRKPFVAFGRSLSRSDHAWVDPDFEGAVEDAVDRLAALGHRHIALMLASGETNYKHVIRDAYLDAMKRRGFEVAPDWLQTRPAGESGGLEAGAALIAANPRPTAVLVSDTRQTFGLYRALHEVGIEVGRDISIIGLLPETAAQILSPALTTFQTDWTAIGSRLGEALIEEIARLSDAHATEGPGQTVQCKTPTMLRPGDSVHRVATESGAARVSRRAGRDSTDESLSLSPRAGRGPR